MSHSYLFVCGTPRSGTSAMWRLLAGDSRIAIGQERYNRRVSHGGLSTDLFEEARFFDLREGDTGYKDLLGFNGYYTTLRPRYSQALYRGDKLPGLANHLGELFMQFPDAKVIVMVRNIFDVAASYERRADAAERWPSHKRTGAAIRDWRQMLKGVAAYPDDSRVLPVVYEDFFFSDGGLERLYNFLGIDITQEVRKSATGTLRQAVKLEGERVRDLSQADVLDIALNAPFGLYRDTVKQARAAYAQPAAQSET